MKRRSPPVPRLAQALVQAVQALQGMSLRDAAAEFGRQYVTHPEVLSATRSTLAGEGLTLVPVALRLVDERRFTARDGEHTVWLWEQVAELVHAPSGERMPLTVQVVTPPDDWGAGAASTMADKLLLMRLLRLSGDAREPSDRDGETSGRSTRESDARELAAGKMVARVTADLRVLRVSAESLASWWADAQQQLRAHDARDSHWSVVRKAFHEACAKAGLDPDQLPTRAA